MSDHSLQEAVGHHRAGRLNEAEQGYRSILQTQPGHAEANHNLGILILTSQQPAASLEYLVAALEANPAHGQYWLSYIDALIRAEQHDAAREVLAMAQGQGLQGKEVEALALRLREDGRQEAVQPVKEKGKAGKQPDQKQMDKVLAMFDAGRLADAATLAQELTQHFPQHPFGWKALGTVLTQLGRTADALLPMLKAAELAPKDAQAHSNLGITLQDLGRLDEAERHLRRAVALDGRLADAHSNLGSLLQLRGKLAEAEASLRRAVQLQHGMALLHYNLGNVLHAQGKPVEAEASYRQALQLKPDYAEVCCNLGIVLQVMGRLNEAEAILRKALRLNPGSIEAYSNLGSTLHDMGRLDEACVEYEKGLQFKPGHAEMLSNLGNTLHDIGRLVEAEVCYRKALTVKPDSEQAYSNLGNTLQDMGRLDEAIECFRRALQINPEYLKARSNFLFSLNLSMKFSPEDCLAEARRFGKIVSSKISSRYTKWPVVMQPERLRIGFVSADFRNHPVGYFLENVLGQLASSKLELIAYPTFHKTDELTARIKPFFSRWEPLYGKSDEDAARLIHDDKVHILIDLSGHTQHNRLPVFSWKPAPVQIAWLGYFATTGVSEIDYIIGDPYVSPADEARHFTEKIWQLPECYWCFSEPDAQVEVSPLPALSTGHITFGCFNNLSKMNDAVVALWAKVLHAVPESRLFLKYSQFNDPQMWEATLQRYAKHGIASDRLILEGSSPRAEYLACYHRVDIALDPFPYPGGTTSMESLWMGVPIISMRGRRFLSHAAETIAHNAGLSEWIAGGEDDYIAKAMSFSSDLERLSVLRTGLRRQVVTSPLFDAARFARNFEEAMWKIWTLWPEQQKRVR